MKIKIIKYMDGEARVVLEEDPTTTICIKLSEISSIQDFKDKLKTKLPVLDTTEEKFNSLLLKSLEGTDI